MTKQSFCNNVRWLVSAVRMQYPRAYFNKESAEQMVESLKQNYPDVKCTQQYKVDLIQTGRSAGKSTSIAAYALVEKWLDESIFGLHKKATLEDTEKLCQTNN